MITFPLLWMQFDNIVISWPTSIPERSTVRLAKNDSLPDNVLLVRVDISTFDIIPMSS
jgi:hypothetical protein